MTLGEFIKKYREEHDLSSRAFAAQVGISHQYVIMLENGKNNDGKPMSPTWSTYKKIAKAVGMSEMDFLAVVEDYVTVNPNLKGAQKELMAIIPYLDDADAAEMLAEAREKVNPRKSPDGQE